MFELNDAARAAVKEAESALLQLWQEKVARLRRRARADRLRVEQLEAVEADVVWVPPRGAEDEPQEPSHRMDRRRVVLEHGQAEHTGGGVVSAV